jgi:hypothetical protein
MLHVLLHSPTLFNNFWFHPSIHPSIVLVLVMSTWNYILNVMNSCPEKWRNLERLYVFELWHNSFLLIIKVQREEENNKDDDNSKCFINLCWKYKYVVEGNKIIYFLLIYSIQMWNYWICSFYNSLFRWNSAWEVVGVDVGVEGWVGAWCWWICTQILSFRVPLLWHIFMVRYPVRFITKLKVCHPRCVKLIQHKMCI